ncbi:hypothetical protein ACFL3P_04125 [Pseudomonadota bacterium]
MKKKKTVSNVIPLFQASYEMKKLKLSKSHLIRIKFLEDSARYLGTGAQDSHDDCQHLSNSMVAYYSAIRKKISVIN